MLDNETKTQLAQYLALLESDIVFSADLGRDADSQKVAEFLEEVAAMTPRITIEKTTCHEPQVLK